MVPKTTTGRWGNSTAPPTYGLLKRSPTRFGPAGTRKRHRTDRPAGEKNRRFRHHRRLWLILFCSALFNTAWGNPVAIDTEFQIAENRLEIVFKWPESETPVSADLTERELVFRFNRPIRVPEVQKLSQAGRNWIENLVASYDSLFIRLTADTRYQAPDFGPGNVRLMLTRTIEPPPTGDTASIRLQVLRARLLFQQGNDSAAIDVLDHVLEIQPDHLVARLFRAEILYQTGHRREAIDALMAAERLAPDNTDIAAMKERFLLPFRPFMQVGSVQKTTCDQRVERFDRLQLETRIGLPLAVGLKIGSRTVIEEKDPSFLPADENRQAEVYGRYETNDGSQLQLSVFLDPKGNPGLSGDRTWGFTDGTMTFGIDVQRPNSDYFTATLESGAKHRLRGRYASALTPRVWLDLFAALNRYRLEDTSSMPLSGTLQAGIDVRLPEQLLPEVWSSRNGFLVWTYRLDSETPLDVETADTITPARFTRLTQTPGLSTGIEQGRWRLTAYGGYHFRADSADGAAVGGRLSFQPDDKRQLYLSADHAIDPNACAVLTVGLGLYWII